MLHVSNSPQAARSWNIRFFGQLCRQTLVFHTAPSMCLTHKKKRSAECEVFSPFCPSVFFRQTDRFLLQHIAQPVRFAGIFLIGILVIRKQQLSGSLRDQKDQASFHDAVSFQFHHIRQLFLYAKMIFCLK